jgi:tetratricopeptide (TPR) repeat protein
MSKATVTEKQRTGDVPEQGPGGQQTQSSAGKQRMSISQAMEQAHKLLSAGQLGPAAQLCSQIVSAQPRMAEARNLMAAILHAQGNSAAAVKSLQRAINLNENNAQFYSNLGEIERQRGKPREALVALRRAVSLDPKFAQAWNNLGIVHYDRRDFKEAIKCYEQAISLRDSYPEAYNNLANALRALGKNEDALDHYQRALLLRENYPEVYNNMASILRDRGDFAEAEHAYRKAISLKPRYLDAYNNLAMLLVQRERDDEALRVLGRALEIDAKHVSTLITVARTQLKQGNYVEAEQAWRLALKEDLNNAEVHAILGQVLDETDRLTEALESYETALTLRPELIEARNLYAICLKQVGRLDDARAQFLKTLELYPWAYGCYANLADLEKFTPGHPHFLAMEAIVQKAENPNSDPYMALHFGLGKAYEDLGQYEKAFEHFQMGTSLKRAQLKYDEAEAFGFFDAIRDTFNEDFFANRPFEGNPSPLPVFIVGMPRSGSTLIEQILSSHPQAFGAGEIKEFSRRLGALRGRFPSLPKYPQIATKMKKAQYQILADGYLGTLQGYSSSASRVTDKLLTNYYFVGMLHVLFPNAKFIHTKRNPVDTCLSSFTKLFKDDMPHSYDLGEIGQYYKKYEELMAHWDKVLPPGVMMTVVYEDVVDDVENAARKLIDFIGLEWDPACVSFHESNRPVKTASVVQVRQPVYKTSVEKWRHYGERLQPLLDALGYEAKADEGRRRSRGSKPIAPT